MGLIVVMAVCAAYVLVDVICLPQRLNKIFNTMWFNQKPFNCKTCLSGWLAIPLLIGHPFLHILYFMCIAMVASVIFNQILYKLL